jgi:hypothetical protein
MTGQGNLSIAIGQNAGRQNQSSTAISIGSSAGVNTQGANGIAVGSSAGGSVQGSDAISIGNLAGQTSQGNAAISIGNAAGNASQGIGCIAIGQNAGNILQRADSIAIGRFAGFTGQATGSIAIGFQAGMTGQRQDSVAIGRFSGFTGQGTGAIAIGYQAGMTGQGTGSICIGYNASFSNQASNSIILNSSGVSITGVNAGLYIAPVRNDVGATNLLTYNTVNSEICCSPQYATGVTSITWSGNASAANVYWQLFSNTVSLTFNTATTTNGPGFTGSGLPTALRPQNNIITTCFATINGTAGVYPLRINAGGTIELLNSDGTSPTVTTTTGFAERISVCYCENSA